jgi:hypothetical protein
MLEMQVLSEKKAGISVGTKQVIILQNRGFVNGFQETKTASRRFL